MKYDVTIDRDKYIGGSDIPIIMGISSFRTRWELLLEKAGLKESDFKGNKYTEYGNVLEPKIRAYVNETYGANFEPNQKIDGDLRANTDGWDGETILEIKTTSHIYPTITEYQSYLVQLLFYMSMFGAEDGILAVYERPEDFNTEFDVERLQIFKVYIEDYKDLLKEINFEIDRFRADLKRLKENPLLTEEDFQPTELITLSNKVLALENRMAEYKAIEAEYKAMKQELYEAMTKYDVKTWETYNGTKITRVDGTEATSKTVEEFDIDKFKEEHPKYYKQYSKTVEKKTAGRSGYVKVTLPK